MDAKHWCAQRPAERRWVSLSLAVFLLSFGADLSCSAKPIVSAQHPLLGSGVAPSAEMTLDGNTAFVPSKTGPTVVDFWATWCKPCVAMMPALQQLARQESARGVQVIGIAIDDNPGLVQERLRELGITYPNVLDGSGQLRGRFRVLDVPATIVLDRKNRVRFVTTKGEADLEAVRSAVDTVLAEKED